MKRINLLELSALEVGSLLADMGLPPYRTDQLLGWMYQKGATSIAEITEYSMDLRARLSEAAFIGGLEVSDSQKSADGTEKFAFKLSDGNVIESVLIPGEKRLTLCISSQAGCAQGCRFCLTGRSGLVRNLKAHEIVSQVLEAGRLAGAGGAARITNIVLMGMGEPLHNLDETCEALWRMTDLMGISPRRITLSTSGLAGEMLQLPQLAPRVNLAVSLNATTDEVRDRIMPVNRRYPIGVLMEACREYPLPKRSRITFEYVMLGGLNDSPQDARRLVKLLHGIRCKVNIIPFNPSGPAEFSAPPEEGMASFQEHLAGAGITATVRKSMGADIMAACGQLSGVVKPHFS